MLCNNQDTGTSCRNTFASEHAWLAMCLCYSREHVCTYQNKFADPDPAACPKDRGSCAVGQAETSRCHCIRHCSPHMEGLTLHKQQHKHSRLPYYQSHLRNQTSGKMFRVITVNKCANVSGNGHLWTAVRLFRKSHACCALHVRNIAYCISKFFFKKKTSSDEFPLWQTF